MTDPARDPLIARFGLRPLPGATRVTNAQIEEALAEVRRRRCGRIQAANDAVAAYMRASGTRHYQAAFNHIERTRPELFADMRFRGTCKDRWVQKEPYLSAIHACPLFPADNGTSAVRARNKTQC